MDTSCDRGCLSLNLKVIRPKLPVVQIMLFECDSVNAGKEILKERGANTFSMSSDLVTKDRYLNAPIQTSSWRNGTYIYNLKYPLKFSNRTTDLVYIQSSQDLKETISLVFDLCREHGLFKIR